MFKSEIDIHRANCTSFALLGEYDTQLYLETQVQSSANKCLNVALLGAELLLSLITLTCETMSVYTLYHCLFVDVFLIIKHTYLYQCCNCFVFSESKFCIQMSQLISFGNSNICLIHAQFIDILILCKLVSMLPWRSIPK